MIDTLGERLRTLRGERGLSQSELARELVSPSYISLIEADKRVPEREVLDELARRLKTSVDYLETGVDATVLQEKQLAVRYAELALENGQIGEALQQFRQLAQGGYPAIRHRATWGLARALEARDDTDGAIATVESLLAEARADRGSEPGLLVLLNAQCRLYRKVGDLALSIELGERAIREVRELGLEGTEDEIRLASTLVGCYWERGDLTRAYLLVQEVIKRAERHGSHRSKGSAYWNASLVAEARGQRQLAIELAERALALLGEGMDQHSLSRMRMVLAWLLLRVDRPDVTRAEELLSRAHVLVLETGVEKEIAQCETEWARCLFLQGRSAEAAELAQRAIGRLSPTDMIELARARLMYGQALIAMGETVRGEAEYSRATERLGLSTPGRQEAQLWREIAEALLAIGRNEEALAAYRSLAECVGTRALPVPNQPKTALNQRISR